MSSPPPGISARTVSAWPKGESYADWVAEEVPVALVYNGISHAVMMASPNDLEHFALGFSFTEGIIHSANDIQGCEVKNTEQGIVIELSINQRCFAALKKRRRAIRGISACGLCGIESLQMLTREMPAITSTITVSALAIQRAVDSLQAHQLLQGFTGAVHAAAFCDPQGNIEHVAEDIGRHNALDKLIGALLRQVTATAGFIILSSRISFEMVQKAVAINVPIVVGISAPTTLAIDEAQKHHLCLVGFARTGRHIVYCGSDRLTET